MNLDERLRAALTDEADMQYAPAPDVDRLISGGRVRRRRRSVVRAGVTAAAAVLVAGATYGSVQMGSDTTVEPAAPSNHPRSLPATPPLYRDNGGAITPGTYRVFVGLDDANVEINADITFVGPGWRADNYPLLSKAMHHGAVAVYEPTSLSTGTGCAKAPANANLGQTPQQLSQQLARLPRSTLLEPPTPVKAFGRDAIHLQVQVNNDCGNDDVYRVAETLLGGHGISYSSRPKDVVIDFWVLFIRGVPVVVDLWHETDASSQLVTQATLAKDSITFVDS